MPRMNEHSEEDPLHPGRNLARHPKPFERSLLPCSLWASWKTLLGYILEARSIQCYWWRTTGPALTWGSGLSYCHEFNDIISYNMEANGRQRAASHNLFSNRFSIPRREESIILSSYMCMGSGFALARGREIWPRPPYHMTSATIPCPHACVPMRQGSRRQSSARKWPRRRTYVR